MKATGIVRRMDELGRVVIPKEIRKTLRIKEGDPLEIFTEQERLLLRKYSPVSKIDDFAKSLVESLFSLTGSDVMICDTDGIVAAKGPSAKELVGQKISREIMDVMEKRQNVFLKADEIIPLTENGISFDNEVIAPVLCEGDVIGAVIVCKNGEKFCEDESVKLSAFAADFIARQF